MKRVMALMTGLMLSACATPISDEALRAANYGPPPPANYQEIIKAAFEKTLIDPTSPLYTFEKPRKGYIMASPIFATKEQFGWRVCGTINSKNRFGGYVGAVPFIVLFKDKQIVENISGDIPTPPYNIAIKNGAIQTACERNVPGN